MTSQCNCVECVCGAGGEGDCAFGPAYDLVAEWKAAIERLLKGSGSFWWM